MEDISKENEELEEGECSDQDDIGMSNSDELKQQEPENNAHSYRQGSIPQIVINSDQSDQEDSDYNDDDDIYRHSKKKKTWKFSTDGDPYAPSDVFVNPLRSTTGLDQAFSSDGMPKKRRNNIWGSVMTEQILSQDIRQFGVNASLNNGDRSVESYDFTIAKEDDRSDSEIKTDNCERDDNDIFGEVVDLEKEVRRQNNRKRKRNVKERLGARAMPTDKRLGPIYVKESDGVATVTQAIIDALREQNIALFTRIVSAIGSDKAIELYHKTVDVEEAGGMMVNNGFRRRTPGGVYIQLLKSDSSITDDVISAVFEQENQKWNERKKELRKFKKAARKKWKRKAKRMENMDFDRPETPTPTKELEELENSNEVDVDVSDLPDRPDTPEPKDSSDNVSEEEEDEEEEDIAVAIAKAKAAILKKQKELADGGDEGKLKTVGDECVDMS